MSGVGKVGDGGDCFLLDRGGVVGLVPGGLCRLGRVDELGIGIGKVNLELRPGLLDGWFAFPVDDGKFNLELRPSLLDGWFAFPDFAVVLEHACGGNYVERGVDNLSRGERRIYGGKLDGVLDLIKEGFDGEVYVVWRLHAFIVGVQVGWFDLRIYGVEVRDILQGCHISIYNVPIA